jgi:hypothetical protein
MSRGRRHGVLGKIVPAWVGAVVVIALGQASASAPSVATRSDSITGPQASTYPPSILRQEVRLRKLHLVRPDLIQFPVAFEIYC